MSDLDKGLSDGSPKTFLVCDVYYLGALKKPNIVGRLKGHKISLETSLSVTFCNQPSEAIIMTDFCPEWY